MRKKFVFALLLAVSIFGVFAYADPVEDFSEYFVDPIFLRYVREAAGVPEYHPIGREDLDRVTRLVMNGSGVRSLSGIELLANLEYLTVADSNLTELDVSHNHNLTSLNVHHNFFESEADIIGLENVGADFQFGVQRDRAQLDIPAPTPHPELNINTSESAANADPVSDPTAEPELPGLDSGLSPSPGYSPPISPEAAPETEQSTSTQTGAPDLYIQRDDNMYILIPQSALHNLGNSDGRIMLSVDMVYFPNEGHRIRSVEEAEAPGSLQTILVWVAVVMACVTFLLSIVLLIKRIKKAE